MGTEQKEINMIRQEREEEVRQVDEAIDSLLEGNYTLDDVRQLLIRHSSRYCLRTVFAFAGEMDHDEWLTLLGEEWSRADNTGQYHEEIVDWLDGATNVIQMMNAQERLALEALPEVVTLYRGCVAESIEGMCWSTSRDIAEWFAHRRARFGKTPLLLITQIEKAKIIAVKLCREEQEAIIYTPENLEVIELIRQKPE